ncbi:MAG: sigma-70 family RNA polymerase sigma factor, partial [Prevotella sp.]
MDNNVILSDYYQKNLSELRGFAMRIVKDEFIAKDIVQDTFVRLLNIKEIIIGDSLPALIYKTLQNLCFDYIRRTTHRVEAFKYIASCQSTWHDMESEIYAHDICEKLEMGISTMSKRYQTIYRMNIFEGKQVSDITKVLG